ncbi:hypothetical protein EHI8A_003720 [Entamoeba histolytica HM-1:IMSS-B]|uniref:Uncharacterized protein n=6 Tax=Entamoeba histolytica TaxID=5759 RepID=C4LV50_ENTH1|nr:hypothetical protein EHI_182690 [Entamoeba histolytica HM-1:IMSS]EMD45053.1 Hypothetical protein EHI5A_001560 [Entamoeba histolytica KU27]EMH72310.1 hypothetical protein EHI8A_003720 [Entamoeba histolytica HM-1:IMSS-B]EMS10734.1 hypothetical protein KM1_002640 [Entamoeba histolytica HM-3:IMSS]ENY63613.1 hypothetical protein EHI7A_003620 [Entamoeba histolytica HM-1:IMSS-A]GAT92531.1 hypothetical protein CL6EHI_182690 [Entamoeba histolytica]|eukprot:XP_649108.1 hypothetical protein EHI_182690 [Entamoeba histolytica HM-1:IMSS]
MNFFKNILGFGTNEVKNEGNEVQLDIVNGNAISDEITNNLQGDKVISVPPIDTIQGYEYTLQTLYYSIHSKTQIQEDQIIPLQNNINLAIQLPLSEKELFIVTNNNPIKKEIDKNINFDISFNTCFTIDQEEWCVAVKQAFEKYLNCIAEKYDNIIRIQKETTNNPIKEYPLTMLLKKIEDISGYTIKYDSFNDAYNGTKMITRNDLLHTGDCIDITVNGEIISGWLISKAVCINEFNIIPINQNIGIIINEKSRLKIQKKENKNIVSIIIQTDDN